MTHHLLAGPRSGRARRTLLAAGTLAGLSVLLAACGSSSPQASRGGGKAHTRSTSSTTTTTAATSGTSGATSTTTAPSGTSGPSGASSTTSPTSTSTTSTLVPVNGNVAECTTSNLGLSLGSSSGSAGAVDVALVFTNTGSLPCYLYGYPGVSAVTGPNGQQIGLAAERATQLGPPAYVTLQPDGKANADLHIVDALNYPAATCHPTTPAGFRVYPPGSKTAGFVASSQKVCALDVPHGLAVGPVASGASSSVNGG